MLHFQGSLVTFAAATLLLNITPGPDMIYVVTRAATQGRSAGLVSALGIACGCSVHILAVALGVARLLQAAPSASAAVRFAGAAYLLWLGFRALMQRDSTAATSRPDRASLSRIFWQGVVTNVLNPKVALFFLAFLPQFVAPDRVFTGTLVLGTLFNVSGTVVNGIVALTAGSVGTVVRAGAGNSPWLRWLTGGVFIGLGLRLAVPESH